MNKQLLHELHIHYGSIHRLAKALESNSWTIQEILNNKEPPKESLIERIQLQAKKLRMIK